MRSGRFRAWAGLIGAIAAASMGSALAEPARADRVRGEIVGAPGDDFYRYANQRWIDAAIIPAGAPGTSRKSELAARVDAQTLALIRAPENLVMAQGTPERALGAAYAAFNDTALLDRLRLTPLSASLARIEAVRSADDLAAAMGWAYVENSAAPFAFRVYPDPADPKRAALTLVQSGLGRGSREAYAAYATPDGAVRRDAYIAYVAQLLGAIDPADAPRRARAVYDLEARLAGHFATFAETQDLAKANNPVTMRAIGAAYPGFAWQHYLDAAGLPPVDHIVIAHPGAVRGTISEMQGTPIAVWRDYLRARLLDNSAEWLHGRVRDARFDYAGRVLQHRSVPRPRGELAVQMLQTTMPELIGQVYVARATTPGTKIAALRLVAQVRAAMRARLATLDWMDAPTRREAIAKLDAMDVKVGWPDRWTDYADASLRPDDLVGNMRRVREAVLRARIRELRDGRDAARWRLPVTDVQAAYDPVANELTVAAAILKPPFFDANGDAADNFGALGAIIGHEISHAFDGTGRTTDALGKARDWWSPASAAGFDRRAAAIVREYAGYRLPGGLVIDGERTRDENIADIGGLSIAYAAYRASHPSLARVNGMTGAQRFYLAWGRMRVVKQTDAALKEQLAGDSHAPAEARVNVVVRNQTGWYAAFGVPPSAKLYRAPAERVTLW